MITLQIGGHPSGWSPSQRVVNLKKGGQLHPPEGWSPQKGGHPKKGGYPPEGCSPARRVVTCQKGGHLPEGWSFTRRVVPIISKCYISLAINLFKDFTECKCSFIIIFSKLYSYDSKLTCGRMHWECVRSISLINCSSYRMSMTEKSWTEDQGISLWMIENMICISDLDIIISRWYI